MNERVSALAPAVRPPRPDETVRRHYTSVSWIEGRALEQVDEVAAMEGVRSVSVFPDLHPGKYGPVGVAIEADLVYPLLVGNDIGCGMSLFMLDLTVRKIRPEKAAERLRGLEGLWNGYPSERLEAAGIPPDLFASSLGTIGGGNHFCELQALDTVLGGKFMPTLAKDTAWLLVHSGSRGLGTAVFAGAPHGSVRGLLPESEEAAQYMAQHDIAVRWASLNRQIIAERAAELLGAGVQLACDVPHNLVEKTGETWLHRKGAARAIGGLVPIAGSRAALSYIVAPGPNTEYAHRSLAHGAGRKHDRASMHARVGQTKSAREALTRNQWGGHIVCEDRGLLLEEATEAYKDAGQVVASLQELGLAEPLATFRPIVTFKRATDGVVVDFRAREKDRSIERRKRTARR